MKRTILTAAVILLAAFTACGQNAEDKDNPDTALTATPTETPTPAPLVCDEETAVMLVMSEVDPTVYLFETPTKYIYENEEYFRFAISHEGSEMQPEILVKIAGGEMFYLENGNTVSEFRGFPLDKVENLQTEGDKITDNDAVSLLKGIAADKLGLTKNIDEYEIVTDSWTSMMYGAECYGVNVYDTIDGIRTLAGAYYISVDGKRMFRLELDEYIEVKLD